MEDEFKPILCIICLSVKSDEDCRVIDESVKNALDMLLLKLSVEDTINCRVCNACCTKVFEAIRFKTLCTNTEDSISPYLKSNDGAPINLKGIYFKERGKDGPQETSDIEKICRLCMQVVTCGFKSVRDVDTGFIRTYIPEVNFNATENPVLCTNCLESLKRHTDFLGNCLGVKKFDNIYENEETESQFRIITEKIEIKSEEDYEYTDTSLSADQATDCKSQGNDEPKSQPFETQKFESSTLDIQSNKDLYKCDICNYETKYKSRLWDHQLKHKDVSEVQAYTCDKCNFQTKHRKNLIRHELIHEDISDIYKCDKCDFETRYKKGLTNHQVVHKDISQMHTYKCDMCSYQAKRKGQLKLHQLRHKDASQEQIYECDACNYRTNRRESLKRHMLVHKDVSEIQMYTCEKCDYKTRHRESLTNHRVVHRDVSEMLMYKCELCSYQAKRKGQLKLHQLTHKDASQVHMYQCDSCSYETKYSRNLISHKLRHKDSSEVRMYKCHACNFETKYKHSLATHQQRH